METVKIVVIGVICVVFIIVISFCCCKCVRNSCRRDPYLSRTENVIQILTRVPYDEVLNKSNEMGFYSGNTEAHTPKLDTIGCRDPKCSITQTSKFIKSSLQRCTHESGHTDLCQRVLTDVRTHEFYVNGESQSQIHDGTRPPEVTEV